MGVVVAIVDRFAPEVISVFRDAMPDSWSLQIGTGNDVPKALNEADVAFVMAEPMPGSLLGEAKRLSFIQKLGSGVDRIDLDWCKANGVGVARLFAGNAVPVAEHTVMLMLAVCRRLPQLDRNTRAGKWQKEESRGINRHLFGKTVGIVGMGAVGRAVARILGGFGVGIVYYDPVPVPPEVESELGLSLTDLATLLATADVVTLHLPLAGETRHLMNADRIAAMKPGAILINCARGELVDGAALADALKSGHLFGAGLDAFAAEPPVGDPLLDLENTVITPHCAGATLDNIASVAARAVKNAALFIAGSQLPESDVVVAPVRRVSGQR